MGYIKPISDGEAKAETRGGGTLNLLAIIRSGLTKATDMHQGTSEDVIQCT
jgi:hypothetical protein